MSFPLLSKAFPSPNKASLLFPLYSLPSSDFSPFFLSCSIAFPPEFSSLYPSLYPCPLPLRWSHFSSSCFLTALRQSRSGIRPLQAKALSVSSFSPLASRPRLKVFCLASCLSPPPRAVTCGGAALNSPSLEDVNSEAGVRVGKIIYRTDTLVGNFGLQFHLMER